MNSLRKALPLILTLTFLFGCSLSELKKPADAIDFPDKEFLNALIKAGVDTNGDGYITIAEAEAITRLEKYGIPTEICMGNIIWGYDCTPGVIRDISNISGIEYFAYLDTLILNAKLFESIDLSNCSKLTYLEISATSLSN